MFMYSINSNYLLERFNIYYNFVPLQFNIYNNYMYLRGNLYLNSIISQDEKVKTSVVKHLKERSIYVETRLILKNRGDENRKFFLLEF